MRKEKGTLGFTLLELLIVVIIVGILAAVALPQFARMTRRSRFAEARSLVGAIATGELAYYQEQNTFTTAALAGVNIGPALRVDVPPDSTSNFDYDVLVGDAAGVTVTATGAAPATNGMLVTCVVSQNGTRTITDNE